MITSVTRKGREVLLQTQHERAVHLTADRATTIARQMARLPESGPSQVLYQERRSEGYTLAVIASPAERILVVGLTGGRYGDIVAGWPYEEAREAAAELLRVALDITRMPERKKRAA